MYEKVWMEKAGGIEILEMNIKDELCYQQMLEQHQK